MFRNITDLEFWKKRALERFVHSFKRWTHGLCNHSEQDDRPRFWRLRAVHRTVENYKTAILKIWYRTTDGAVSFQPTKKGYSLNCANFKDMSAQCKTCEFMSCRNKLRKFWHVFRNFQITAFSSKSNCPHEYRVSSIIALAQVLQYI